MKINARKYYFLTGFMKFVNFENSPLYSMSYRARHQAFAVMMHKSSLENRIIMLHNFGSPHL